MVEVDKKSLDEQESSKRKWPKKPNNGTIKSHEVGDKESMIVKNKDDKKENSKVIDGDEKKRVLMKNKKGYALPYEFWLALVFGDYSMPAQVWSLQTTKDVIGIVEHLDLPISMRSVDTPLQRARNALVEQNVAMIVAQTEHDFEKALLRA
ncbi:hypothetical protein FXO37_11651 [Capsicum annuum]|nr:hypothetical protein FXO37_11651 [Capsicum annuum]